ncbi:MAG: EAL domain-containing protein [Candidatus Izemoplasmatales bacterium]
MAKAKQKKYSLSKRIVSLTTFINAIFLITVTTVFLFYTYVSINDNQTGSVQNQTNAIISSTSRYLEMVKTDANLLAEHEVVIDYLNYINAGNDPVILDGDPNYSLYYNFIGLTSSVVEHQTEQIYDTIFVATEVNCLDATNGCAVGHEEDLVLAGDYNVTNRPWYISLGNLDEVFTEPYADALTGAYTFTHVVKVYDQDNIIGYLGIDISLASLANLIESIGESVNSQNSRLLVFNNLENKPSLIFYSSDKFDGYFMKNTDDFLNLDESNDYPNTGIANLINNYETEKVIPIELFGDNYLATFTPIENYDWEVVVLARDSMPVAMELIFIGILLVIGILVYITSRIIRTRSKRILAPINKILESLTEIKNGNYKVRINLIENNELKDIADAINLMSKEIDYQVNRVYETFAYDGLTGLKNLQAARLEINQNIFTGNRKSAVCVLQVENIKNINIIKGQIVGDNLIKSISEELRKILGNSEHIYASSQDEFIYIMTNITSLAMVESNINKIMAHFKEPIAIKNVKFEVKLFIGISIYPTDGALLDDLVKKSDTALYKAKQLGNRSYLFYNENIAREISYKAQVSEQLAKIIANKELYLKYQPLLDNKNELYGFEALARWSSPILGEISPSNFISNAEENYMIVPIGNWVLTEACEMQVRMKKAFEREFVISVNVSSIQLIQYDFVDTVKEIIKETDITPEYLTLELTESVFLDSTFVIEEKIKELKEIGIKLSLDDFGTGYASLTYLRQIAFDNIKIDKSFIDGIFGTENDHKIVGTIVNLVQSLEMKVIAEGVEERRQYEYLKQLGTDVFQGFLISEPLPESELKEFIKFFYKIAKAKRLDVIASKRK